jgi:hypothetical protein
MMKQADRVEEIDAVLLKIAHPFALIPFKVGLRQSIAWNRFRVDTNVYTPGALSAQKAPNDMIWTRHGVAVLHAIPCQSQILPTGGTPPPLPR